MKLGPEPYQRRNRKKTFRIAIQTGKQLASGLELSPWLHCKNTKCLSPLKRNPRTQGINLPSEPAVDVAPTPMKTIKGKSKVKIPHSSPTRKCSTEDGGTENDNFAYVLRKAGRLK